MPAIVVELGAARVMVRPGADRATIAAVVEVLAALPGRRDDPARRRGSARLRRVDPESYLRDLFRVLVHWPKDRHLELAPKYWAQIRARLEAVELAAEIGPLTIPPPLDAAAAPQQVAAD